jgi:hypothetical protein
MLFLRYLLLLIGFGLFIGAAAILVYDLYTIFKGRKPAHDTTRPFPEERRFPEERKAPPSWRWPAARKIATAGIAPVSSGEAEALYNIRDAAVSLLL